MTDRPSCTNDGKTVVLFGAETNKYVTIPVPNTIQGMLEKVMGRLGIDFPLADLLTDAPDKSFLFGVTSGREVGTVTIDGVSCRHLLFLQPPGIELELWVEKNDKALPRRLIVTYRSPADPAELHCRVLRLELRHPSDGCRFHVPAAHRRHAGRPEAGCHESTSQAVGRRPMKRLVLICLCAAFVTSAAQEAFAWGAVRGPNGGAALPRSPWGRPLCAGPNGGVAVRGPVGGVGYRGGAYYGGGYHPYAGVGVAAGVGGGGGCRCWCGRCSRGGGGLSTSGLLLSTAGRRRTCLRVLSFPALLLTLRTVSKHVVAPVRDIPPGGRKLVRVKGRPIAIFNIAGEFLRGAEPLPAPGWQPVRRDTDRFGAIR